MDSNEFYLFNNTVESETSGVKYTGYSNVSMIDATRNALYIMNETEKNNV